MRAGKMRNKTISQSAATIRGYLEELCVKIPNRHPGSPGNRAAVNFFAEKIAPFDFITETPGFDCIDWECGDVLLQTGGMNFSARVAPYSLPCRTTAPLKAVSTMEQLEKGGLEGRILLIHGELAGEQLMPKHFPFYNPESHRKIISLLEQGRPAAIIAATSSNPELAGAVSPFPLIEDGDFDIPSVYMTDREGEQLSAFDRTPVTLEFDSRRIKARGSNVIARKGKEDAPKILFCAHIDTKKNTPGALDNGTGIAALLALAELLKDYTGPGCIEITAFNGEDYYAASGEKLYLEMEAGSLDRVTLAVNLDAAGYREGNTEFSFYQCPVSLENKIRASLDKWQGLNEGPTWPQSDHMVFVSRGRPALAFTSQEARYLFTHITHTPRDTIELVDCEKIAELASALADLAHSLLTPS